MSEEKPWRFTGLLYGEPNAGKTRLADSIAQILGQRTIVISTDGGYTTEREGVEVKEATDFQRCLVEVDRVKKDAKEGDVIILDNLSALAYLAMDHLSKGDKMTLPMWGQLSNHIRQIMTKLLNTGASVIFIAWLRDETDSDGNPIRKVPDFVPSLLRPICGKVSYVWPITVEGAGHRYVHLDTTAQLFAKTRTVGFKDIKEVFGKTKIMNPEARFLLDMCQGKQEEKTK